MARRESLASLLSPGQPTVAAARTGDSPAAVLLPVTRLAPNPQNPREDLGDLSDLKDIVGIQLQSVLAVTRGAYLRLWPEYGEALRGVDHVIVNGCRRHAAAVRYGRPELITVVNDEVAASRARLRRASLDENANRKDFDPIEEARAVKALVEEYESAAAAARAEGWSAAWVSQRTRLLLLAPEVQSSIRARAAGGEGMSLRDARWLAGRPNLAELSAARQFDAVAAMKEPAQAERFAASATPSAAEASGGGGDGGEAAAGPGRAPVSDPAPAYTAVYAGADTMRPTSSGTASATSPVTATPSSPRERGGAPSPRPAPAAPASPPDVNWADLVAVTDMLCERLGTAELGGLLQLIAARLARPA
ncbi:ParB/RepB/Spo0J family partition protein [Streptacidiphilus sp. MAP12-20]|uniref:ParB/RepB/Spo0J family partition protein n=1 Tax=Streptacidiphilus sp. MAP12-20 TaxID=3156299 RepID=UPI003510F83F